MAPGSAEDAIVLAVSTASPHKLNRRGSAPTSRPIAVPQSKPTRNSGASPFASNNSAMRSRPATAVLAMRVAALGSPVVNPAAPRISEPTTLRYGMS